MTTANCYGARDKREHGYTTKGKHLYLHDHNTTARVRPGTACSLRLALHERDDSVRDTGLVAEGDHVRLALHWADPM